MKILLTILIVMFLVSGCTSDTLHVERGETVVDANINYLLQDKNFKSLEYNVDTGTLKVENFGSETSEIISELLRFVAASKTITP